MTAKDIVVGGIYTARIGNPIVKVRVESINKREGSKYRKGGTSYTCTNLSTNRTVHIKSATKFRSVVSTGEQPAPQSKRAKGEFAVDKGKSIAENVTPILRKTFGKPVANTLVHGDGRRAKPVLPAAAEEEPVGPLLTQEDKQVITERRKKMDADYVEIRAFEQKVGHPWWEYADRGESWAHYRDRGCPLTPPAPVPQPPQLRQDERPGSGTVSTPSGGSSCVLTQPTQQKPGSPAKKEPVKRSPRANGDRKLVCGEAVSTIMRWIGAQGWGVEECEKLVANLDLGGAVDPKNHTSFVSAGKRGFRVPALSEKDAEFVTQACGKGKPAAPPSKKTKK